MWQGAAAAGIGALGSLGSSMFGGGNSFEMPPEIQKALRKLMKLGKQAYNESYTVPGALPEEQAALAGLYASIGRQFAGSRDQLLAARGTGTGAQGDAGQAVTDDFLMGLDREHQGDMMAAAAPMFQSFIKSRRDMRYGVAADMFKSAGSLGVQAGGLNMQAAGMNQGGGGMAQLAQAIGYSLGRQGGGGGGMQQPIRPINGIQMGAGGVGAGVGGFFQPQPPARGGLNW